MIRVLPPEVINQIAAGEVVERPFSVVKELVENSLDAGATRVAVEIEEGGHSLIRVRDDGAGFTPEDLELAFVSHATSKLAAAADLDHIASLGFRGEALASIGSVSRAQIKSRPGGAEAGAEVRADAGRISPVRPCGTPPGSVIEVKDLFANVPARRRFLKTPAAERARIQELLIRTALVRRDVEFTLTCDGRETLRLPAGTSLQERVGICFGEGLARSLLPVELDREGVRVAGCIAAPDAARRDSTQELLFVNGRCAKDKSVTHSIRQAFRDHVMGGRFPVYFLEVAVPPDRVDVNVHPSKAEVRFLETRKVAGLLYRAVQGALAERGGAGAAGVVVEPDRPRARSGFPELGAAQGAAATGSGSPALPDDLFGRTPAEGGARGGAAAWATPRAGGVREPGPREFAAGGAQSAENPSKEAGDPQRPSAPPGDGGWIPVNGRFLQVMDLYLLFETDAGLVIVDQHALHEKVLFEQLKTARRARLADGRDAAVQRLLVPAVVELAPADKEWLLAHRDTLAREGLLLEDFGGPAVAVQGVPAEVGRVDPKRLLDEILAAGPDGQRSDDALPSADEQVVEHFHHKACRAAVKAGDRMSDAAIQQLLEDASKLEQPHNCPHGRPTVLTFSRDELDRYFRRIVPR